MWGDGRGILLQSHTFFSLLLPFSSVFNTSSSPSGVYQAVSFSLVGKTVLISGSGFGGFVVVGVEV